MNRILLVFFLLSSVVNFRSSQLIGAFWFVERFKMGSNLVDSTTHRNLKHANDLCTLLCVPALYRLCGEYYKSKYWHNTRFERFMLCSYAGHFHALARSLKTSQINVQCCICDQVYIFAFVFFYWLVYHVKIQPRSITSITILLLMLLRAQAQNENKTWSRYICKKDKWCVWFEIETP